MCASLADAPSARVADPNNIFNALTQKMRNLELNQSLINNWLTLWQNQTTKKMKVANATQEEALGRLRAVQANVSEVQGRLGLVEEMVWTIHGAEFAVAHYGEAVERLEHVEGAMRAQQAAQRAQEERWRRELAAVRTRHRLELLACAALCLGAAWLLAARPRPG